MTKLQRRLYKAFIAELILNKKVSNPLKAFAVCCKIWNHPDVLYNFAKGEPFILRYRASAESLISVIARQSWFVKTFSKMRT